MATTPPTITPAPPAPQRNNRSTFSDLVDAFVLWLVSAVTQFNALATNVYNNAVEAFTSATSAQADRLLAQAAAQTAVATPSAAATTTTSMQLGFGTKSFTLAQTNKTFSIGQIVSIASTAAPRDWMSGVITAFTPGTGAMTVSITNVGNATAGVFPTVASWIVSLTGPAAQTSQQQALSFVPVPMPALDMDLSQGEWFLKTITGNSAFTWSNVPQPPYGKAWVFKLTITSGMVSFPSSVRWTGVTAPTLQSGRTHIISFSTTDGGALVQAAVLSDYLTT